MHGVLIVRTWNVTNVRISLTWAVRACHLLSVSRCVSELRDTFSKHLHTRSLTCPPLHIEYQEPAWELRPDVRAGSSEVSEVAFCMDNIK